MIGVLERVGEWSRSQQVLRLVVFLGPLVAVIAAGAAGAFPPAWLIGVVALTALGSAWSPESGWVLFASVVAIGWWCRVPDDGLSPAVLIAAVAVLTTHVAALLAAYGPPEALVTGALVRRWLRRGSVVLLAAPVVWGVAVVARGSGAVDGSWVSGMVAAVVVLVAGSVALVVREEG